MVIAKIKRKNAANGAAEIILSEISIKKIAIPVLRYEKIDFFVIQNIV